MQTLIVNIYAPLGYNNAKNEFFNNTLDVITNYDGENVIFGGDFNITNITGIGSEDREQKQKNELPKTSIHGSLKLT